MTIKRLIILSLSIFSHFAAIPLFAQSIEVIDGYAGQRADSVFETLNITDKINQLLIFETEADRVNDIEWPGTLGAVLLHSAGPTGFVHAQNVIQNKLIFPGLIFTSLSDPLGIDTDSITHFASLLAMSAVAEPHLFYETGQALAKQCQSMGVNGLIFDDKRVFLRDKNELPWRLAEMNRGFVDEGVLPLNTISLICLEDLDLNRFLQNPTPQMILIDPDSVYSFHEMIRDKAAGEELDLDALIEKSRQILQTKYGQNLMSATSKQAKEIKPELNDDAFLYLREQLYAASFTILKNENNMLPIRNLADKRFASLTIGKSDNPVFNQYLDDYARFTHFQLDMDEAEEEIESMKEELADFDFTVTAIYFGDYKRSEFFQSFAFRNYIEETTVSGNGIIVCVGDPDYIDKSPFLYNSRVLTAAYDDDSTGNMMIPQVIFGGRGTGGVLPKTLCPEFTKGFGLETGSINRFEYTVPEAVGLDGKVLARIDSIVYFAIAEKAIPGCQVLVAKDNSVVYRKAFGYFTYDSLQKVGNDDLYDLASLTKVSGALPALMKLSEEGKFDLDAPLGTYLKYFKRGNKKDLTFREILAHQAGLRSWIPYWKTAVKRNGKFRRKTMDDAFSENYPYEIAEGIYLHKDYKSKIYKQIKKSKVGEKKYLYSGLVFYLFPEIIEAITGENYEDYVKNNFYKPLGAATLTYNPLREFDLRDIVPTEYDSLFRKSQIHGKVHDEGAAMMEGVSSNAGLFSNSNDLAKLFQMYCNYGTYGDQKYLNEEIVREYSRCAYPENSNRRALGFDRPLPVPHPGGNTAVSASQLSFGHTGFTGTFAWADPQFNLVYIFLSNRVYPSRENTKLYDLNIRTDIQQVIYDAMMVK